MRAALAVLVLTTGLAGCEAAPTETSADASPVQDSPTFVRAITATINQKIPFELAVFISCAAGGAGEVVDLSGTLHDLFHLTINGKRFVLKTHDQPQGVSGVGETTGDVYRATGVTQDITTSGIVGNTETFINNFKIIGPKAGNNFLVHENFHVTVNANGTITVVRDHLTVTCK